MLLFFSKFIRKTPNVGICNLIWGKSGVTHSLPWLMARWKAHVRLSIRCLLWFQSYQLKCVQLVCFHRGRYLITVEFYPIKHSWQQKTRDTWLANGQDRIPLCCLVLTQYRSVTDRQTDGRISRSKYSVCKVVTRGTAIAEEPCEHTVSWNRVKMLHKCSVIFVNENENENEKNDENENETKTKK